MFTSARAVLTFLLFTFLQGLPPCRAQITSIFLESPGPGIPVVIEENREIVFNVIAPFHSETLTVDYRIVSGTAENGADFIAGAGTLTFNPSEWLKSITVQLLDDRLIESNEFFQIVLTNAVPAYPIGSPSTGILIRDDETGYAAETSLSAWENDGSFTIPIHRRGDFDFTSSVEVFLEPDSARPGVDYIDQTFTVNFAPNETEKFIQVELINNTIEDNFQSSFLQRGDRYFNVGLRNPTDGVPIERPLSAELVIRDNELGYSFRIPAGSPELELLEGDSAPLILERRGDYDVSSVATVKITPLGNNIPEWWLYPSAEAGADFVGSEFQSRFAPGQTIAEVPLVIVNDALPEAREWLLVQYSINLAGSSLTEIRVSIRDNEFNPLPVTQLCLGFDSMFQPVPLQDGKFLAVSGNEMGGFNYQILRFNASGEFDPDFTPMVPNGRPTKIVEGADGKFTVRVWRNIEEGLQRFEADGRPDTLFQPITQQVIYDFEVASNGQVYLTNPFRRLNIDGSVDGTFNPPAIGGDDIVLDSEGKVYVEGDFVWHRLISTGAIDQTFSDLQSTDHLFNVGGILLRYDSIGYRRITETGAPDPAFTPLTNGYVQAAPEGKFYVFEKIGSEVFVHRHNSDGTLDATYLRGTLDTQEHLINVPMLKDGTGFLLLNSFGANSLNGVPLWCDPTTKSFFRVDLNVSSQTVLSEPNKSVLRERNTGEPKTLSLIRTGDNSAAATVRYRVRSGTAIAGTHYLIDSDGEVQLPAGVSRGVIPITIIDNQQAESDRTFFVDLLNSDNTVWSTVPFTIRNDDVGIEVLSRSGSTWRILPISGEFRSFSLRRTSDFITWEPLFGGYGGVPRDVEMLGPMQFLSGHGYD